jgi:hypothetical protein
MNPVTFSGLLRSSEKSPQTWARAIWGTETAFLQFKQREQPLRFAHERAWLGEVTVPVHRTKLD